MGHSVLEKLTVTQLVIKLSVLYETSMLITMFKWKHTTNLSGRSVSIRELVIFDQPDHGDSYRGFLYIML